MGGADDVEGEAESREGEEEVVERNVGEGKGGEVEEGEEASVPEGRACRVSLGRARSIRAMERTCEAGDGKDEHDEKDAFDGAGEGREVERPRVELFPGREVEVGVGRDEGGDCL